jgi:4-hydroxybenzoate polyprenyltransferase
VGFVTGAKRAVRPRPNIASMNTVSPLPVTGPLGSGAPTGQLSSPSLLPRWRVLRLVWQEARPVVQLVFLLRFLTGLCLADRQGRLSWSILAAAGSWLCVTTSIYVLNGISDVSGDRANGSTRPIASGQLPVPTALWAVAALAIVGVALSVPVRGPAALLAVLMLGLGWAYSMARRPLKNSMPGFMTVVTAGGLLTYLAGFASVDHRLNRELVVFGLAMSLWMGLGGSTKDLPDAEGDRIAGRRTWPVVLGERNARLAMAASALMVGSSFVLAALHVARNLISCGAVVLAGSIILTVTVTTSLSGRNRATRRRPYRIFMATQYLTHLTLLGGLTLQF